jgi:hypothetical protein
MIVKTDYKENTDILFIFLKSVIRPLKRYHPPALSQLLYSDARLPFLDKQEHLPRIPLQ